MVKVGGGLKITKRVGIYDTVRLGYSKIEPGSRFSLNLDMIRGGPSPDAAANCCFAFDSTMRFRVKKIVI